MLDWTSDGFGKGFALYLFLVAGFQLNYLYLYFVIGNRELFPSVIWSGESLLTRHFVSSSVVTEPQDVVRIAGLLRGTESAAQAVSYGLQSIQSFGTVGGSALNFGLWGFSLFPAWLIVREIGVTLEGRVAKEARVTVDILEKVQDDADEEKVTGLESKSSEQNVLSSMGADE